MTGHNLAQCTKSVASTAVWYTTVKLNDHLKLGLWNTKGLFLCFTITPRSPAMSTKATTKWILEMSDLLDMRLTITSDFSWKPGFQYRIRNLGMITLPSQRSTNLWHAYKSHATFSINFTHFFLSTCSTCRYLNHVY